MSAVRESFEFGSGWDAIANDMEEWQWDEALDEFEQRVRDTFFADWNDRHESDEGVWRVTGLPLWDGARAGFFVARCARDVLRGVTVERADWRLHWRIERRSDRPVLHCVLWHHDAPTGGAFYAYREDDFYDVPFDATV